MGVDVEQVRLTGAEWRQLLGQLAFDAERIADRLVRRLGALPSYRPLAVDDLRPGALTAVRTLLEVLPTNGSERRAPHGLLTRLGETRARQGVSAGDLVLGWHAACDEIVRRARELLTDEPATDRLLLQLYGVLLDRQDGLLATAAEAHRGEEVERARRDQNARAELVRAVLSGRLSPAALDRRASLFRLDRSARYYAVRARPGVGVGAAAVERYLLGAEQNGDGRRGVLALVDDDLCGFLLRLPGEPAPVPIGTAPPVPLEDLPEAFRTATRMLRAAVALGRTGTLDVGSHGAQVAVVTDDEVGDALQPRYVRPLEDLGAAGELVLDTVDRYLGNDSRLDPTARQLHVHANTVRYRLGRYEQLTGGSLRATETLVEVWWALRRRSLRRQGESS
jgi:hypothetical protein